MGASSALTLHMGIESQQKVYFILIVVCYLSLTESITVAIAVLKFCLLYGAVNTLLGGVLIASLATRYRCADCTVCTGVSLAISLWLNG
ncbi:hypothetical protein AB0758_00155 [Tolypothrix bouteillei VB521301_2]|uniref:hypothetical protein n=1 Tax=Tolypothrix bouteillei TaxID=1246981 RepID=UPI0010FA843F